MLEIERDEEREYRISMEAIVDAYGPEEQALGWFYYLEDKLCFPFSARCIGERIISPLCIDETVTVIGMADAYDCLTEMFVLIKWAGRSLGVPLSQLQGVAVDSQTEEAIADWHYWVGRGYVLHG